MRLYTLVAVGCAMAGLAGPAAATDRADIPAGWRGEQTVRHFVYYPRYRHFYYTNGSTDPFAYDYRPNGYYPYYNSGYWRPACKVKLRRANFKAPTYYPAWGASRKVWNHAKWHAEHHGRHDHAQW